MEHPDTTQLLQEIRDLSRAQLEHMKTTEVRSREALDLVKNAQTKMQRYRSLLISLLVLYIFLALVVLKTSM